MYPKVSIIWLNYNSLHILDIVRQSLKSLFEIDYPNYEVIIIDNSSTDGSYKEIKKIVSKLGTSMNVRMYRTSKNYGFTGGNNIGFKLRSNETKYVLLVNNDAILEKSSLLNLVEYMEMDNSLGACQGIILKLNRREIDTAGDFLDELLFSHMYLTKTNAIPRKPFYVTYADGSISLVRVKAALTANKTNKLFDEYLFAYLDDNLLGLKLWNSGFKVISIPIIAGYHYRSGVFGKINVKRLKLSLTSSMLLAKITNCKYKKIIPYIHAKRLVDYIFNNKATATIKTIQNYLDVISFLRRARIKLSLDLYKAPLIKVNQEDILLFLISRRKYSYRISEKITTMLNELEYYGK